MEGLSKPDLIVALIGGAIIGSFLIWRLLAWIMAAPVRPNPWDAEIERRLQEPDALPVCHHCFTPYPTRGWFCENCGCAVGPYNNWMPYLNAFSEGEVFRNGVNQRMRVSFVTVTGYFLMSFSFLIATPIYWYLLAKNLFGKRPEEPSADSETPAQ